MMRIAIFGDVHGNLLALESFLREVRGRADRFVCLGDVVNYGPWNDECLEIVSSLPGVTVLEGNHERLFSGVDDPSRLAPLVREFFERSCARFSRLDLISGLPRATEVGAFHCAHTIGELKLYADTEVELARDHFVGHTHHQFSVLRSGFRLVNPGSVGQNRRYADRVDFALFDDETNAVELASVGYDLDGFIRQLKSFGYPAACIDYYSARPRRGR